MLVFNMMNEKLKDKVVAIELAGNNILIANDNDNFKNLFSSNIKILFISPCYPKIITSY